MGKEFVTGYHSIADGEKDPRNLLLAFSIGRVVLIEFDISSHVEVPAPSLHLKQRVDQRHTVLLRRYFLLFPNYLQTSAGRPIWHHLRTAKGETSVRTSLFVTPRA